MEIEIKRQSLHADIQTTIDVVNGPRIPFDDGQPERLSSVLVTQQFRRNDREATSVDLEVILSGESAWKTMILDPRLVPTGSTSEMQQEVFDVILKAKGRDVSDLSTPPAIFDEAAAASAGGAPDLFRGQRCSV